MNELFIIKGVWFLFARLSTSKRTKRDFKDDDEYLTLNPTLFTGCTYAHILSRIKREVYGDACFDDHYQRLLIDTF